MSRPAPGEPVMARIRHNGHLVSARIDDGEKLVSVRFDEPVWAVAPGQAVVLYQGDQVLGGGWIRRAVGDQ